MKATRLSLWEQNSEIRGVFTLWLEALEARGIAPRTLENYREGVGQFVAFLEQLTPEEERAVWLYAEGATLSPKQRTLAETALQKIRRMLGLE